jgi:hypothetical protein
MSLINDALKRATQAQPPSSTPAPDSPMRPTDSHGSVGMPVYFMPVLLFVVAGACFFIVQGWDAKRQSGLYPDPITIHAREAGAVPDTAAIAARDHGAQPVQADRQFALNDGPASARGAATAAIAEESEPTPALRLQGIFYRPSKPSAVINSQTVFIGDSIAGGKVKAITRDSVTLFVNGETKVLTLH